MPTDAPAHHAQVAATQARVVKGEVGLFVVPGPLDLHRPLLHKNLSRLCPAGPEAGHGVGGLCTGGELSGGFCNTQSDLLVPVLGECYHCWLLRKSPRWGEPASPQ